MRLKEKALPVYKTEESIKGLSYESITSATSSQDNQMLIQRANELHGGISENFVRNQNFIYE